MDGIPRPTPFIQALILAAGLLAARVLARAFDRDPKIATGSTTVASENIIVIGATHLSSLYIKLLNTSWPDRYRFLAVLDDRAQSTGRSMAGINILASTQHLESVIDEFIVHGLPTHRVIVGGQEDSLDEERFVEIRRICAHNKIKLDFVPHLVGLTEMPRIATETAAHAAHQQQQLAAPNFDLPRYFEVKPFIDFFAALSMILFFPVAIVATFVCLLDVGTPLLFWQQRIGQGGRKFLLYKFRTLKPPFDDQGRPVPEQDRLSRAGKFMRQTRLDELPQLLNVLVGDMSLIGPRPLLPEDQPKNPTTRLLVRPGMTGWAQVNGGKFLTPEEKDDYDEYYIRNATPWFDLYIVGRTLKVIFRRGTKSDHEVAAASRVGFGTGEDLASNVETSHATGLGTPKRLPPTVAIQEAGNRNG
jgi:lipopolysaccharide/colanic/teichoic acid biosynthesis glycosyltransferase